MASSKVVGSIPLIPQASPALAYLADRASIDAAFEAVMSSGRYVLGEEVAAFEAAFATAFGVSFAVGVGSGTAALSLALRSCGIGRGDSVITVSHTAVATVAAIELAGAVPLLVDVDEGYGLDAAGIARALDHAPVRPRAVVPVHLYGQPVDIDAVRAAAGRDVVIVEDCAQATGARWRGVPVGAHSAAAAFSFYPTKNLAGIGDGGLVATSDPEVAQRTQALRQYGWSRHRVSEVPGDNSRLDEIQAAVLRVRLRQLEADNARRADIAALYDAGLSEVAVTRPWRRRGAEHVFHQYVIEVNDRDSVQEELRLRGVATLVHYPVPVHRQPAYAGRVWCDPFGLPHTERAAQRVLSLPMFPQLTDGQVFQVIEAVCDVVSRLGRG